MLFCSIENNRTRFEYGIAFCYQLSLRLSLEKEEYYVYRKSPIHGSASVMMYKHTSSINE